MGMPTNDSVDWNECLARFAAWQSGSCTEKRMTFFDAACRPTLIGSLPAMDGGEALDLVMAYTPHIPIGSRCRALPTRG